MFIIPTMGFAQDKSKEDKWSFGVSLSPGLNVLLVDKFLNQTSKVRAGVSAGVNVKYWLWKLFSLRTGAGYGIIRYDFIEPGLIYLSDIDPSKGEFNRSRLTTTFSFKELQIPLLFQVDFYDQNLFVAAGAEFKYIFKNTSTKTNVHESEGEFKFRDINNPASPNSAVILSGGYRFRLSPKRDISIETVLKLYVKPYVFKQSQLCVLGLATSYNF